ncbi:MAG: hypothetical protein ABR980_01555 [Ignavibacteriaceae bacterium]|jgi:hypothetical protein
MRTGYLKTAVVVLILLVFSIRIDAQPNYNGKQRPDIEKSLQIFTTSLKSDIPGIVESTIYNVVVFKKYFPEKDYARIANILNSVARENEDPSIRYKAYLAEMYLNSATKVDIKPESSVQDHEYIFIQIADQLEKNLLVADK